MLHVHILTRVKKKSLLWSERPVCDHHLPRAYHSPFADQPVDQSLRLSFALWTAPTRSFYRRKEKEQNKRNCVEVILQSFFFFLQNDPGFQLTRVHVFTHLWKFSSVVSKWPSTSSTDATRDWERDDATRLTSCWTALHSSIDRPESAVIALFASPAFPSDIFTNKNPAVYYVRSGCGECD